MISLLPLSRFRVGYACSVKIPSGPSAGMQCSVSQRGARKCRKPVTWSSNSRGVDVLLNFVAERRLCGSRCCKVCDFDSVGVRASRSRVAVKSTPSDTSSSTMPSCAVSFSIAYACSVPLPAHVAALLRFGCLGQPERFGMGPNLSARNLQRRQQRSRSVALAPRTEPFASVGFHGQSGPGSIECWSTKPSTRSEANRRRP
jgi:hypothetical protein